VAVRAWACVALPLFAVGCSSPEPTESASDLLSAVGVTAVGPLAETPILPWRLDPDPDLRIGDSARGTTHQFTEITAVLGLPDGSVLVADRQSGLVRRYGRGGDLLQQLGAVGEGPGEFRSPTSLAGLPGDSVVVWDAALWRASVFDGDGRFARTVRYDPTANGIYPLEGMWPMEVLVAGGGMRLVRLASKPGGKGSSSEMAGPMPDAGLAIHAAEARLPQLLARLPGPEDVEVEAPWGAVQLNAPLAAGSKIAFHPPERRTCVGHQRSPEILCVAEDGTRLGVRWSEAPRPVDPNDRTIARWRSGTVRSFGEKVGEGVAEGLVQQVPVPHHHPAFGNLLFDDLGYLWIELGPVDGAATEREYLVVDGEYAVAGRFHLPSMELVEIGADYLLGIRRDGFDVEELVRMELTR
jgi:hypothetical protein